jgi:hypothetical protein
MENSIFSNVAKVALTSGLAFSLAFTSVSSANASQPTSSSISNPQASISIYASSVSLANAKRSAQNYIRIMGFSRSGLINQLVFEGYSKSISTRAVDSLKANWNKQAVRVAKNYLNLMPFSRQGLIDQLKFDGFSSSQAAAGAKGAGY